MDSQQIFNNIVFFEHSVNPDGALSPDYFIITTINYLVGARNVFSLAFILIFFFGQRVLDLKPRGLEGLKKLEIRKTLGRSELLPSISK